MPKRPEMQTPSNWRRRSWFCLIVSVERFDSGTAEPYFFVNKSMAENIPSLPGGAVPPKPPEASKVQPKKETVRINLPPKPSAAPTIKLPTLPPGGPTAAPGASGFVAPPTPPPAGAPALQKSAAAPLHTAAPAAAAPAAAGAKKPAPRPQAPATRGPALTTADIVLAVFALVAVVAAAGSTGWCYWVLQQAQQGG